MKKAFILIVMVFVVSATAHAQVNLGIKVGANYANLRGSDVLNSDAVLSYHGGGVLEFGLNKYLSLQPEVLYSMQGNTSNFNVFGSENALDNAISYVHVPILLKFYLTDGFSLDVGPQFGFNVSSASSFNGQVINNDYAQGVDYGLAVGAGYKTKSGVFFQGRYNAGFAEVIKGQDIRNSVVSLSVGYLLLQGE